MQCAVIGRFKAEMRLSIGGKFLMPLIPSVHPSYFLLK